MNQKQPLIKIKKLYINFVKNAFAMKFFSHLVLILFFSANLSAQYDIKIDAFVFDKDSKAPLEYANIGFKNKSVKDISTKEGQFNLVYDEHYINENDIFVCSLLGYQTLEVKAAQLYKLLANTNRIYLKPKRSDQLKLENVSGYVTDSINMLQGAKVSVKNSFKEVRTDVDGRYSINANENDVLVISHLGMLAKEVLVGDRTTVDVELKVDGQLLDEIFLKQQAKEQEILNTGYSEKKEDAIGYSVEQITADEISPAANNLADVIVGKFAGVQVAGHNVAYNTPQFIIRGGGGSITNPAMAIFVVDGIVYQEAPDFIIPQNIESITLLKSIIATNRYGTIGRGGAFLIKTKTLRGANPVGKKGSALVKGNDYDEQVSFISQHENRAPYMSAYLKTNSFKEAKDIYQMQNRLNKVQSIPYYLDVASYFIKYDEAYAFDILSNIADLAIENPKALKVLAYKYEELSKLEEAKLVYQQIAKLRPTDAQSYRDLAYIYQETGYYKQAIELYKNILSGKIKNVDFSGLLTSIENELRHLLKLHRTQVNLNDFASDLTRIDFKIDLRIVFEWNDPNTEFQFQFVDPNKKYFTWEHSMFENKERMLDEVKNGYHSEEFIIDDAVSGEWIINIENFSDESMINPTYLKYTVYKNYALENETKNVKVIKLFDQKQKVTLDKFIY